MTDQLKSALDMLNACPDADAVAELLRRHGIKGTGRKSSCHCPLAEFYRQIGNGKYISVGMDDAEVDGDSVDYTDAVRDFVEGISDLWKYSDLIESEAA